MNLGRRKLKLMRILALVAVSAMLLVACGGDDESGIESAGGDDNSTEAVTEAVNSNAAQQLELSALAPITPENAILLTPLGVIGKHDGFLYMPSTEQFTVAVVRIGVTLKFSPDGRWLVSGGGDGTAYIWDMENGGTLINARPAHEGGVWAVAFNADGTLMATGGNDGMVRVWDMATLTTTPTTPTEKIAFQHDGAVAGLAFSPDSSQIAGTTFNFPTEIIIWDVATGNEVTRLSRRRIFHTEVAYRTDGQVLYSASGYGSTWRWDLTTNSYMDAIGSHGTLLYAMAVSRDGQLVAMGSESRSFSAWNIESQTQLFGQGSMSGPVTSLDFNPDGSLLAVIALEDATVHLWDVATAAELIALEGSPAAISNVAFSPNGNLMATIDVNGDIQVWGVTADAQQ